MAIELFQQIQHVTGQAVTPSAEGGTERIAYAFIRLRQADGQRAAMSVIPPVRRSADPFALNFHGHTTGGGAKSFWLSSWPNAIAPI